MKYAAICGLECHLPAKRLTTEELAAQFPNWGVESLDRKTGIHTRHIAEENECASDLAVKAAEKLFSASQCEPEDIDFILLCTQSPDYVLPTTACLLQDRLNIPKSAGALDFNLGCSGFVYGLGLCEGLISSGQANRVLLITADTYSKYINPSDRNTRTIFGDGAAAVLVAAREMESPFFGAFIYGTDGSGGLDLVVPNSGARKGEIKIFGRRNEEVGQEGHYLVMNGKRVFDFAVGTVPRAVRDLLQKGKMSADEIKFFVFHQANAFLIEEIRRMLGIAEDRCPIVSGDCGNTVASSIPITLKYLLDRRLLQNGDRLMLIGFGVGLSWAARIVTWSEE